MSIHSAGAPQQTRVSLWDNARFLIIVLVVVGHMVATARTGTSLGFGVYVFIYLFHMPAMIALSGLFARAEATPRLARSTLQLLVTWVTWETIWALIRLLETGRGLRSNWLVSPGWTLWFLVTLATMRILLPYVMQLRHPLVCSVVLALVAGLSPVIGTEFSASRTLCFLPFFVAGHLVTQRGWLSGDWFMRPQPMTRAAAALVLAIVAVAVAIISLVPAQWRLDIWLPWRDGYAALFDRAPAFGWVPGEWWQLALGGAGLRLLLLAIAAVMTLALLLLVPRGRSVITVWGARTLYVYLLHAPIVHLLRSSGAIDWVAQAGAGGVLVLIACGIALAIVLSMAWVARVFRPIVEPRLDRLFVRS